MIEKKFILLGLPASGKTTFLAALWAILTNGSSPGDVVLGNLTGEQRYLNRIRKQWLDYKEIGRTTVADENEAIIPLKTVSNGVEWSLCVPEIAGENYRYAWESRSLPKRVAELVKSSEGVALFLSSTAINKPIRMDQTRAATFGLTPEDLTEPIDDEDDQPAPKSARWQHAMAPTQVVLVELLQFVEHLTQLKRISIVISAWDDVREKTPSDTPEQWLKRELPLLSQFLRRNPGQIEARVFGVSAQGGDYAKDIDRLANLSPEKRPAVYDGNGNRVAELISTLKWLAM